jgi:hypothetical protein
MSFKVRRTFSFEHSVKESLWLNLLAFLKVPLLFSASPKVIKFNDNETTVFLPFKRKNKNHLGSMYFGALAMGAELSVALMAIEQTRISPKKVSFIFKDFKAEFLKRADGGTYFTCEEAKGVKELVKKAEKSSDRVEQKFKGYAYVDKKTKEPVMTYELTLSLKARA